VEDSVITPENSRIVAVLLNQFYQKSSRKE
jgi:hypothetical protein